VIIVNLKENCAGRKVTVAEKSRVHFGRKVTLAEKGRCYEARGKLFPKVPMTLLEAKSMVSNCVSWNMLIVFLFLGYRFHLSQAWFCRIQSDKQLYKHHMAKADVYKWLQSFFGLSHGRPLGGAR
ncbi:Uncharacterized protein FWK35_00024796, partial [Aphis craccivora]